MIAFIAKSLRDGAAILRAEMPDAHFRVSTNGDVYSGEVLIGRICSSEDHIMGLELSGFVILDECDSKRWPATVLLSRVRKPFYWHGREQRAMIAAAKDQTDD